MPVETNTPNTNQYPDKDPKDDMETARSSPATRDNKPDPRPEPYHKSNKDASAHNGPAEEDGKVSPQTVRANDEADGEQQRHQQMGGDPGQGDTGHAGTV